MSCIGQRNDGRPSWFRKLRTIATLARLAHNSRRSHGLIEGAAHETAVVKLGLLERLDGVLDDESRRTRRDFQVALERVVAEGKAQNAVRAGAVEIWAAVWLATLSHALEKVVAGDWKPPDTGVRLIIDAAWRAISV